MSQSVLYCALNRRYVSPEVAAVVHDLANSMEEKHPGTQTRSLDGNFPFWDNFPLLPHLSHDDGEKLDLALYWKMNGVYQPGRSPSPLGYWGYAVGPTSCPPRWFDLRWDMKWLQVLLPKMETDNERMQTLLDLLSNDERVGKILIEPHLQASAGVSHQKIRFQGCRPARHDDHIHIQL
ncbi:MAG: hypothetical protein ABJL99_23455 [Aliishimia sp.]